MLQKRVGIKNIQRIADPITANLISFGVPSTITNMKPAKGLTKKVTQSPLVFSLFLYFS
jgi:hypothetical protein